MGRFLPFVTCIVLLGVGWVEARLESLQFQVEPRVEECLYDQISAGDSVATSVVVSRGGKLDIRVTVTAPSGRRLFDELLFSDATDENRRRGPMFTAVEAGDYKFCFDNTMSRWTAKVVDFDLKIQPSGSSPARVQEASNPSPVEGLDAAAVIGMYDLAEAVHKKLDAVTSLQKYHRRREYRHRDTIESTNARVMWYTVFETICVVAVVVAQIVIIRHWFRGKGILPT